MQPRLFETGEPPSIPVKQRSNNTSWTQRINSHVVVRNAPPERMILWDGQVFMRYPLMRAIPEERLALVLLVQSGVASQRELARAFGLHHNTVYNWVRDYDAYGIQGLFPDYYQAAPPKAEPVPAPETEPAADAKMHVLPFAESTPTDSATTPSIDDETRVDTPSRYVGVLLIVPFLQAMLDPLLRYLEQTSGRLHSAAKQWAVADFLMAWALLIFQGVRNPEQIKALVHKEFGILFGRRRLFSCETLRRNWPLLTGWGLPRVAGQFLARRLIRLGYITLGTIYLDGHFNPYFGKFKTPKGYWPQHNGPHKGHYQHWANDAQGRPIFCLMHQGYTYFGDIIPEMVTVLRQQMQAVGETTPLIFVFDRGAFSGPLFRKLDEMKVGWITWYRGAPAHCVDAFTHCTWIPREDGSMRHVEYFVTTITLKSYGETPIPALALRDPKTGTQATLISNNAVIEALLERPITPEERLTALLNRWKQENFFKEALVHQDLNEHFGPQLTPSKDDMAYVPNPAYAKAKARLAVVDADVEKWARKREGIAGRYETLQRKPSWPRFLEQRNNRRIIARHEAAKSERARAARQLEDTSEWIRSSELHEHDGMVMDFARRQVLMALRIAVFHGYTQLRRLIAAEHNDTREVGKVLQRLVNGGGVYSTGVTTDVVTLSCPTQPRFRRTAEALIERLNAMEPTALGDRKKRLVFRLADHV